MITKFPAKTTLCKISAGMFEIGYVGCGLSQSQVLFQIFPSKLMYVQFVPGFSTSKNGLGTPF